MSFPKTGVPASRLARDFGAMLSEFTAQVDVLLTRSGAPIDVPPSDVRREICVAVWAAVTAAFEASALTREEKDRVVELLEETLIPFWQQHCATDTEVARLLAARASNYLEGRDPRSQVATASAIVQRLLDRIGSAGESRRVLARKLIPLFAHRMLGDTYHVNDLKMRFGIQLPLLATLCLTAGLTQAFAPARRWIWGCSRPARRKCCTSRRGARPARRSNPISCSIC